MFRNGDLESRNQARTIVVGQQAFKDLMKSTSYDDTCYSNHLSFLSSSVPTFVGVSRLNRSQKGAPKKIRKMKRRPKNSSAIFVGHQLFQATHIIKQIIMKTTALGRLLRLSATATTLLTSANNSILAFSTMAASPTFTVTYVSCYCGVWVERDSGWGRFVFVWLVCSGAR